MLTCRPMRLLLPLAIVLSMAGGCQTLPNNLSRVTRQPKHEQLRRQIISANAQQQQAAEEFNHALKQLMQLGAGHQQDMRQVHNWLNSHYNQLKNRSTTVRRQNNSIERSAIELFEQWEREIAVLQSQALRALSEQRLRETMDNYRLAIRTLRIAEDAMQPVLQQLHDQALYLRSNVNQQPAGFAIEIDRIERSFIALNEHIQRAVFETDAFSKTLPDAR